MCRKSPKFGCQKSPKIGQNSPKIRCQNSPKFRVKITPKKSFLSRPRAPPEICEFSPPPPFLLPCARGRAIFGPKIPGGPKSPQNFARAPGPRGPEISRNFPPAQIPPDFWRNPPLINTCPQDRRRPQAEANKRRPGSANCTRGVARNSVEDTELKG